MSEKLIACRMIWFSNISLRVKFYHNSLTLHFLDTLLGIGIPFVYKTMKEHKSVKVRSHVLLYVNE